MHIEQLPSPCFILDEKKLRSNLELISTVQKQSEASIILAFKGFAMWKSFPVLKEYISGAAASSLYEAQLCFEEMKTPAHVYCPAYINSEFDELMQYTGHMVFNSIAQFNTFYPYIQKSKHKISCGLRVNPENSDVKTEIYNPSSPQSRLGILHEHMPDKLPEGVEGLHFHVLCESTSYALENVLKSFEKLFGKYLSQIKWVNFGGGHLMTRKGYNTQHLIEIIKAFKTKYNLEVILEPGSAFVWDTGVLAARVLDIVQSRGVRTAMLNVSFTAHMPDTLEMPYRPRIRGAQDPTPDSKQQHKYRLGGISCLAGDFMEEYDFGKELTVGDTIIFEDMIHYTMVKTTMFNGVKLPSIAIVDENNKVKALKEFSYIDFKSRLS